MRIEVVRGAPERLAQRAAVWVAERLWAAVAERGEAHVALSGGSTPALMFADLARLPVPWTAVEVWQVDERVAPSGHADRNLGGLQRVLLDQVQPRAVHLMDVEAGDLAGAAARYGAELRAACAGVLDVVHLGLGDDGHTASWPPGDPVGDVEDEDVAVSGEYKGRIRMTLTVPAVNRARSRMFLVAGAAKLEAVERLLRRDPDVPASRVSPDDTTLLLDEAAYPDE